MTFDSETLRKTMRLWATGVIIVGAKHDNLLRGITVSSFTSVALEPPLVLICVQKDVEATQAILESGAFSVSILSETQQEISNLFAGYGPPLPEDANRFDGIDVIFAITGAPILADALGWLDCRVQTVVDGSSHHVIIGEVVDASEEKEVVQSPLLYFNRDYRKIE